MRNPNQFISMFQTVVGFIKSTVTNIWTANQIFNDNVKLFFGTGSDASLVYDGTNLILNPQEVGAGNINIGAGILDFDDHSSKAADNAPLKVSSFLQLDQEKNFPPLPCCRVAVAALC